MSDFDKRLSNMMNEEEHFPNMQQNWERLSPHLQPPQPLKTSYLQKRWFVGIAASVSVLAVSAMSYFLFKTTEENKALKQEVTILKNKTQSVDNKTITHNDNNTIEEKNNPVNVPKNSVSSSENLDKNKVVDKTLSESNTNNTVINKAVLPQKSSVTSRKNSIEKVTQTPSQANVIVAQNKIAKKTTPSVFTEKKEVLVKKQGVEKTNIVQNETPMPSTKSENNPLVVPSENKENSSTATVNNVNEPILNGAATAVTSTSKTNLSVLPLGIILKPTIVNPTKDPLSMEGILMQKPVIMHTSPRTKRFAVGVQTFVSLGESEGREGRGTSLMGYGIVASYDLTRNFEIIASADLGDMRYDFKFDRKGEGPRGTNRTPKEPKDGPKNNERVKGISGKQDRQQFSIGLKYKIPTNTILTPFINAGYDVQRLGKQTCNFNIVNDTTNAESSVLQEIAPQVSSNLWHIGAGLEARIYSFTVDISAQYQKDFSTNNDNRVVVRGGIKYRF